VVWDGENGDDDASGSLIRVVGAAIKRSSGGAARVCRFLLELGAGRNRY
jgi:hypothetical protein